MATTAEPKPRSSELREPQTTWEKMSLPWSVVPKKWCVDGAWRESKSENALGSWVAISGAKMARSTIAARMISPPRDFLFASINRAHCGRANRLPFGVDVGRPRGGVISPAAVVGSRTSGIGWIWDTGLR